MALVIHVFGIILLVPFLNVRTFHTRPPIVCELGNRNTSGPRANTKYEILDIQDCNKTYLPQINCTVVPGSPRNISKPKDLSGYKFGLQWEANDGAGGVISVLKGFVINIGVLPFDRGNSPLQTCLYINITKTMINTQYVLGILRFQCAYQEDSEVTISIQSYPTPDMCPGAVERNKTLFRFFIPSVQETARGFTKSTTKVETSTSSPVPNVIISTVLSCCLIFVLIVVTSICIWNKVHKDKAVHLDIGLWDNRVLQEQNIVSEQIRNICENPTVGPESVYETFITGGTNIERENSNNTSSYERLPTTTNIKDNHSNSQYELFETVHACPTEGPIDVDNSNTVVAGGTDCEGSNFTNDSEFWHTSLTNISNNDNHSDMNSHDQMDREEWDQFTKNLNFPDMPTGKDT